MSENPEEENNERRGHPSFDSARKIVLTEKPTNDGDYNNRNNVVIQIQVQPIENKGPRYSNHMNFDRDYGQEG